MSRPDGRSRASRRWIGSGAAAGLLLFGVLVSSSLGEVHIPVVEVLRALVGLGDPASRLIVVELRLPRVLAAAMVGVGLGLSGALLQSIARNPLASPDILGINAGASVAAVSVTILAGSAGGVSGVAASLGLPLSALIGAFASGGLLYLLALRRGRLDPMRLVVVGVGISAAGASIVGWLLTLGDVAQVGPAITWLAGSLHASTWPRVAGVSVALLLAIPVLVVTARRIDVMMLGDDTASGLGVIPDRSRLVFLVVATVLAGTATSVGGAIAFVALAAPQMAQAIAATDRPPLLLGGLVGGALLVWADLAARQGPSWVGFGATELPVGLLTAAVGAPYLLYVLARTREVVT